MSVTLGSTKKPNVEEKTKNHYYDKKQNKSDKKSPFFKDVTVKDSDALTEITDEE